MAKPFTFHFSHGAHDTPRIMLIVDFQAQCALCGYEEIQRFYHGIAFHSLNIPGFLRFVEGAPSLMGFTCTNCGEEVGPEMAQRGAVTYGFADGGGVIQAHFVCAEGRAVGISFTLDAGKRLDPQSLPPWSVREPRPGEDHTESLSEATVFAALGRIFSLKGLWRSLMREHLDTGETLFEQAAPGCWLVVGSDEDEIEALVAELEVDDPSFAELADRGELTLSALNMPPEGLALIKDPDSVHGHCGHWLQPEALEALEEGRCIAEVYMRTSDALEALLAAMRRARLEFVVNDAGGEVFISQITTPRGAVMEQGVPLEGVLQLAAYTAITPGEAGRMVAEEIVAELLGIDL